MGRPKQTAESFMEYVVKDLSCWIWTGPVDKDGYGRVGFSGKPWRAHRLAYYFFKNKHPGSKLVLHSCNNPNCVNPSHLRLGTITDNNRDCHLAGRYRNGNSIKTHCKNGHSFSGNNLRARENGNRRCRACQIESERKYENSNKRKR